MNRKILTRVLILILAFLPCLSSALADSLAFERHYKKLSGNGRYVFVMLAPRDYSVFENYKMSGLYINDGSEAPLWKVYWYSFQVEVASDGKHLVRLGPWASDYDQEAVSFFENGFLIRTYKIEELVNFPSLLPHTVSHFRWRFGKRLYDEKRLFSLTTLHGDYYVFDITTGEIVSSFRGSLWLAIILFLMLILTCFLSKILFFLILIILLFSYLVVRPSNTIIPQIWIFLGFWICGNILSMRIKSLSSQSQKWKKIIIDISKGKLIAVSAFLIIIIFLAGPAIVKTKIRLYMPKSKSLTEQHPKSSEDYLSETIAKDRNFTAYYYGIVADENTGLEWIRGPNALVWKEANAWVENLNVGGGSWRLPTSYELQTLYQERKEGTNIIPLLKATKMYAWLKDEKPSSYADAFFFPLGTIESIHIDSADDQVMLFAVRSRTNK